jgi:hypothetical protein
MSLGIHLTLLIGPTLPIPASSALIDSLVSVEVTNTEQGRDGFQITFAAGRSGGASDILDYSLIDSPLLRQFNRVIIMVTFGAIPKVLIDGIITHVQLNPSQEPGKSTLTVTGEDVSVMMDREEKTQTYPNQPDSVIVNRIILSYAQYGLIPTVIPPVSLDVPIMLDWIPSHRGTDLSYIKQLATKNAYVFYVEPTNAPGVNIAYWGPPNLSSLLPQMHALSVNMGASTNVASINFQYNALQPQLVSGSVNDRLTDTTIPVQTFASTRLPLSSKPAWLVNILNSRKKQLDSSGMTVFEAYTSAQAQTDSSVDVVTATGEIDSLAYGDILRARKLVGLRGAGNSYDGVYYVKNVTHQIKLGEYKQSFTLSREGLGSLTPVVPP